MMFFGVFRGLSGKVCVCVCVCVCKEREWVSERERESPLTTWISPLMLTGLDINNVAFHSPHPPLRSSPRTHTYPVFLSRSVSVSLSLVFRVDFFCCSFLWLHSQRKWHFSWRERIKGRGGRCYTDCVKKSSASDSAFSQQSQWSSKILLNALQKLHCKH